MRWPATLFVLGLVPLAGCHLASTAAHNALNEPIEYFDQQSLHARLRGDARKFLRDVQDRLGPRALGDDYSDGFLDGYVDYLEHGGQSLPPAVPPLKYRRSRFLNQDGHARIHEYFAGFQQGADTACHSGERSFLTVPVLVSDVKQTPLAECAPNNSAVGMPKCEPLATPRSEPGLPTPVRPSDPLPAKPMTDPKPPPVPVETPKIPMSIPTPDPGSPKLPLPPDPPKLDIPKTTTTPLFHNFPKGTGGAESQAEPEQPNLRKTAVVVETGPTTTVVVPPQRDTEPLIVKPR
jgi:hypothetical protein